MPFILQEMTVYPFKLAPPMYIFTTLVVALAMASGLHTKYIYISIYTKYFVFLSALLIFFCYHSIGSLGKDETVACVSDIIVEDISIQNTLAGVRIKTWQVRLLYLYHKDMYHIIIEHSCLCIYGLVHFYSIINKISYIKTKLHLSFR